jgi:MFS family permease
MRTTGPDTDGVAPSAPRPARRGTFHSLGVRNFRLFVTGQLLSATGTWMQSVAQPWLVLQLTHSGVALGIDTALTFLPILLVGAWGGVVADRLDNRKLQIGTQIAFASLALALWLLVRTDVVQVWMVYSLSFLTGCVLAVDMPTRQSFYLELVGPDDLTNAMSLNTATFTGSRILGAVIAGVLIDRIGVGPVFLVNAFSYGAVVAALLLMRPGELRPRRRVERKPGQVREGIRYAWGSMELRLPLLVMAAVFLFTFNFTVLLPLLATRVFHGGAGTFGQMMSLFGVGSLAGALVMASRSSRANARLLGTLAIAFGAASVAAGLSPALALEWPLVALLGATGIAFAITANSTLQLNSSDEMRGRVMALYSVVFLGSTPLGGTLAGWVGQHAGGPSVGPRVGFVGGGIIAVAAGLAGLAALSRWHRSARTDLAAEAG